MTRHSIGKFLIMGIMILATGLAGFLLWRHRTDQALRYQIGQMLIVGFRGTQAEPDTYIVRLIRDLHPGGVVLFDKDGPTKTFPRNILDPVQVRTLITNLINASPVPLIVSVDAEGGRINRLKTQYGFTDIPSPRELGDRNNIQETFRVSHQLGQQLAALGFNLNFAPVVDVNINPDNPVIGALDRSFSADPDTITRHAMAFIEGQHAGGIMTAIKHFPGHGSSVADSHKGLVDVTAVYQDSELAPYKTLIRKKAVDMVMTAHIVNRRIDPEFPATLSSRFIRNILRKDLGFDGVVISDDLSMGAINQYYGFREALVRAINAGCDLLILSNNGTTYSERLPYDAVDLIFDAVRKGEIPRERILEADRRVRQLKQTWIPVKAP